MGTASAPVSLRLDRRGSGSPGAAVREDRGPRRRSPWARARAPAIQAGASCRSLFEEPALAPGPTGVAPCHVPCQRQPRRDGRKRSGSGRRPRRMREKWGDDALTSCDDSRKTGSTGCAQAVCKACAAEPNRPGGNACAGPPTVAECHASGRATRQPATARDYSAGFAAASLRRSSTSSSPCIWRALSSSA